MGTNATMACATAQAEMMTASFEYIEVFYNRKQPLVIHRRSSVYSVGSVNRIRKNELHRSRSLEDEKQGEPPPGINVINIQENWPSPGAFVVQTACPTTGTRDAVNRQRKLIIFNLFTSKK